MPDAEDRKVTEKAREDEREGKSPSTQAGEFVREEMHHVREGKHGARSPRQAIAIGLSKARRAGVKLPPPKRGSAHTRRQAARDTRKGRSGRRRAQARGPFRGFAFEPFEAGKVCRATPRSRSRRQAARNSVRTKGAGAAE